MPSAKKAKVKPHTKGKGKGKECKGKGSKGKGSKGKGSKGKGSKGNGNGKQVSASSASGSLNNEQARLAYLKNIVMPSLWSSDSAAFVREVSTIKPSEFSIDLMAIQKKLKQDKYASANESIQDFRTLFHRCKKSRTTGIRKAGNFLQGLYNDKMRGYDKKFSGSVSGPQESSPDMEADSKDKESSLLPDQSRSVDDPFQTPQNAAWNCPECTVLNEAEENKCTVCGTPRNIIEMLKTALQVEDCHDLMSTIKKVKDASEVISYPKNWTGSEKEGNGGLRMVPLKSDDPDYKFVKKQTGKQFKAMGCKITSVRRVENWEMFQVYSQCRATMERKNGTKTKNERWLFHGTSPPCIDRICRYGFNRSYAGKHGTIAGVGVYFSSNAATSCPFSLGLYSGAASTTGKMLLCRVLTGHHTVGHPTYVEPPMRTNTERYDSVTGSISNVFVIFSDYHAYPEFEITFQ